MYRFLITAVLLLVFCFSANADVPQMINYQGRLTDDTGADLDTTVSITFTIYDDSTSGLLKWTETHGSVAVTGGLFNVILGGSVPIQDSVFAGVNRFLGIKIGSDPEIAPRTRLITVPYSHRVSTVDGATGGNITGDVTVTEDIGVGATDPAARLDVSSTSTDSGYRIARFSSDPDTENYNYIEVGRTSTLDGTKFGYLHYYAGSLSGAFVGNTPSTGIFVKYGGDVGIGTTSPGYKLDINGGFGSSTGYISGDLHVNEDIGVGTSSPAARLDVSSTNTSDGFRIARFSSDPDTEDYNYIEVGRTSTLDGAKFGYLHNYAGSLSGAFVGNTPSTGIFVKYGGDVGIGTTSPSAKLDINGTARITGFTMSTGATDGYVLTSNASGVGTWQPSGSLPSGSSGQTLRHDGSSWAASSLLSNNGTDIGIGTAIPNTKLEVRGDNEAIRAAAGSDPSRLIQMKYHSSVGPLLQGDGYPRLTIDADSGAAGMLVLGQGGDLVGIGTTDPGEELDVNGTAQMTGFKMPTGAASGYVLTSDAVGNGTWQAAASGGIVNIVSESVNDETDMSDGTFVVTFPAFSFSDAPDVIHCSVVLREAGGPLQGGMVAHANISAITSTGFSVEVVDQKGSSTTVNNTQVTLYYLAIQLD